MEEHDEVGGIDDIADPLGVADPSQEHLCIIEAFPGPLQLLWANVRVRQECLGCIVCPLEEG